jgi:hypothetical protein
MDPPPTWAEEHGSMPSGSCASSVVLGSCGSTAPYPMGNVVVYLGEHRTARVRIEPQGFRMNEGGFSGSGLSGRVG